MGRVVKSLVGEWPLVLAAAALVSLLFLPRFAKSPELKSSMAAAEAADLRRRVETGAFEGIETRLRSFLHRFPDSPLAPEARYLQARVIAGRARQGVFPGVLELNRAWAAASAARAGGFDPVRVAALKREIAGLLLERDLAREAVDRLTELYRDSGDASLLLDLARGLARRAAREPELRQALLDESAARVSEFLRFGPPERRIDGFLAEAGILWGEGRYDAVFSLVERELSDTTAPGERGLLQLERGKALVRLGRKQEAFAALDEAVEKLDDPRLRAVALLFTAELFARDGKPDAIEIAGRVSAGSTSVAPLGGLVAAVVSLKTNEPGAAERARAALADVRRPGVIAESGFDFGWFVSELRTAGARERDPEALAGLAGPWSEIQRLFPRDADAFFEEGRLLLRAGRHREAADRFEAAAASELLEESARARAVLAAADACSEGRLDARASALYRDWARLKPAAHVEGLYLSGEAMRRSGRSTEALAVFAEYVEKGGPAGESAAKAILARGEILAALGRREEAVAEFDRVLKARDAHTDPGRPEWSSALFQRGRTLLELDRGGDGRRTLAEYLERFGEPPGPTAVEAVHLLVRAAIREGAWREGLERLRELERRASALPGPERARFEGLLREAAFLEGDLYFNMTDYESAARAYGVAYRRTLASQDRLWGLIGRGRALARLDRKEEARRDYANARALYEEGREAYENSLGGRGRDWWPAALEALAKEVK